MVSKRYDSDYVTAVVLSKASSGYCGYDGSVLVNGRVTPVMPLSAPSVKRLRTAPAIICSSGLALQMLHCGH